MNERIVKMYRKALATGRTDARTMNWLQANAKKAVFGKLPRWGSTDMSPAMDNTALQQMKRGSDLYHRATFNTGNPLTKKEAIEGLASPGIATVKALGDVVSVPINLTRNLYNTAVDRYNAGASDRNAINQEMTYLNAILEKINADAEAYRQANGDAGGNGMGTNISPNIDNSHYGMGNQATVNNLKYNPNKNGL